MKQHAKINQAGPGILPRLPVWNYWFAYLPFATAAAGFALGGIWTYATPILAFVITPLLDWSRPPAPENATDEAQERARSNSNFDLLVYGTVPLLFVFLGVFCWLLANVPMSGFELGGNIFSMGLLCGVFGINVGHELGHRSRPHEKLLSQWALLGSLYTHFFIEHNRGHHIHVSTPRDPATSRRGETLYAFWVRSVVMSYVSAWRIENEQLRRKGISVYSLRNRMIVYQIMQVALVAGIYLAFGALVAVAFVAAALIGALLLETVNYIEHYGLMRREVAPGRYEPVRPQHSWNSDHMFGRLILFNLPRHSDHHAYAGRKYQMLRSFEAVPTFPAGYPAMMLLSLIPPLWFMVMDRHLAEWEDFATPAVAA